MSLFVIDQEKCKRDRICVAECPIGIIEIKDKKSFPTPTARADELCINCGHCVAVCPHGAITLKTMTPDQCPPVQAEWAFDQDQVQYFLRSRRSIRSYKKKPVEREILTKLIDTARFIPSADNSQPVSWLVVYDSDEVLRLIGLAVDWMRHMLAEQPILARKMLLDRKITDWEAGNETICHGAPHVIMAHTLHDHPTALTDSTIALTYLELAAPSLGLGACWAGYFNIAASQWPPLQQALGFPEGHTNFGAMMIGYPKFKYHRLPLRNEATIDFL